MSTASTRVISAIATLSYPHLDKPQADKEGKGAPKYSAALVFPKGTDLNAMKAAALAAASEKFPTGYKLPGGQIITVEQAFSEGILRTPFRKDALAKGYPEGSIFVNARTQNQPTIVYSHRDPQTGKAALMPADKIKQEMYAGAQVRASLVAFYYDNSGNKGVSFALNNLQKVGEGDRIDGRTSATDEFDANLSDAPTSLESLGL